MQSREPSDSSSVVDEAQARASGGLRGWIHNRACEECMYTWQQTKRWMKDLYPLHYLCMDQEGWKVFHSTAPSGRMKRRAAKGGHSPNLICTGVKPDPVAGDRMTSLMKRETLSEEETQFDRPGTVLATNAVHHLGAIPRDIKTESLHLGARCGPCVLPVSQTLFSVLPFPSDADCVVLNGISSQFCELNCLHIDSLLSTSLTKQGRCAAAAGSAQGPWLPQQIHEHGCQRAASPCSLAGDLLLLGLCGLQVFPRVPQLLRTPSSSARLMPPCWCLPKSARSWKSQWDRCSSFRSLYSMLQGGHSTAEHRSHEVQTK
ncbi:uncharacterized protein [Melanerpes formicivorus]|uniref:uncharacterized protein n=1 Tax=Melanerpes formicivorus TaxID=211600 RepID=UPI00358EB10D